MARGRLGPWFVPWIYFVLALDFGEGQKERPFGEMCLEDFTAGLPDWVLDTDASVQNGATFLSSPMVHRSRDCMRACCKDPACNLALVEQGSGTEEDHIRGCFLLNCLYEQAFVCRFARKIGFLNFLKKDVYDSYLAMQNHGSSDDRPPIARAVKDMRVQPGEPVMLRGTESTDDRGIVSYEWKQILGDPSVEMKKHEEDQVEISNLQVGTYVFQLTVTDTAQQQDFTNITIMVLNSEQTEEHCLTPKKVGWCRGSFPRWFYNPSLQQCEEFIFGGCKPNKNNYLREEECQLACKNVRGSVGGRQQPVCNGNCQAPFFRCKDGCCIDAYLECDETLDCADGSDEMYCEQYAREFNRLQKINVTHKQGHCVDLPDTGQCSESIPRWYYNPFSEKCDPFTYGGCGGNNNNFKEEEECMKSCSGITKADVIGRRWESFESQTAILSAFEVVIAVLLGICIMVVLVIIGYFFLKKKKKNSRRRQPATATNSTLSTTEDTEHLFYSSATKPV
ncbi:kunitz-type protease inhibitor 1 isoform X1 [Empidonax traillii]|uniref:kunitz-type protease inhibitor 1 isoform X1 n=1 Tax=Empidonax traillii TaxID=164674 RepID=UPI000FFD3D92|nr:kunitz-type protease inhibitor 1 isoform X1 [Empidonax traillii]